MLAEIVEAEQAGASPNAAAGADAASLETVTGRVWPPGRPGRGTYRASGTASTRSTRGATRCCSGRQASGRGGGRPLPPGRARGRGRAAAGTDEHRRVTAVIYAELGFAAPLARGLFVLSRSVGILAHAWEESQQGRRNKGPIPPSILPPYRPVS